MLLDLTDKKIVITGGCGHLGSCITEQLVNSGASVLVIGTDRKKFDTVFQKTLLTHCGNLNFLEVDFRTKPDIFASVSTVFDSVSCLINNACYGASGNPLAVSNDDLSLSLDGTIGLYYRCIKQLLPLFENEASIVNVSSMYGISIPKFEIYESKDKVNPIGYGIGKAGVVHMTKYLAKFLAEKRIRINSIAPGAFPTAAAQKDTSFIKALENKIPLGRIGQPKDLSGLIVLLCSDNSRYITGANFVIDGGFTI